MREPVSSVSPKRPRDAATLENATPARRENRPYDQITGRHGRRPQHTGTSEPLRHFRQRRSKSENRRRSLGGGTQRAKAAPGGDSRTGRSAPPSVEDVAGRAAGCDSGERNMAAERGGGAGPQGPGGRRRPRAWRARDGVPERREVGRRRKYLRKQWRENSKI